MATITLKNRFLLVAAFLIALVILTDIFAIARLRFQSAATAEFTSVWLPVISKTSELVINVAHHRRLEFKLLANQIPEERPLILKNLQAVKNNIVIYTQVLEPLLKDAGFRQSFKMYRSTWNDYNKLSEKFRLAYEQQDLRSAERILRDSRFLFDAAEATLKELNDESYMNSLKIAEAINTNYQKTFAILVIFGLSSLIFGLTMTFWHVRRFHRALAVTSNQIGKSSGFISMSSQELTTASSKVLSNSSHIIGKLNEISADLKKISEKGRQNSYKLGRAVEINDEATKSLNLQIQNEKSLQTSEAPPLSNESDVAKSEHAEKGNGDFLLSIVDRTILSKKCLLQVSECTSDFIRDVDHLHSTLVTIERSIQDNISSMRKVNISSEILSQDSKELRSVLLQLHKMIGKGLDQPPQDYSNGQMSV